MYKILMSIGIIAGYGLMIYGFLVQDMEPIFKCTAMGIATIAALFSLALISITD